MDPNLPQSKSVPSNLTANRRHGVSISGSGSYQSHLSGIGHFHRACSTPEQAPPSFTHPEKDYSHTLEDGAAEQRPRAVGRLCSLKPSVTGLATLLSDDLRRIFGGHVWRLRTFLVLYCCFSVILLTVKIYPLFLDLFQVTQLQHPQPWGLTSGTFHRVDNHGAPLAPLTDVPLSQRLLVAFRGLPPQTYLEAFVVQARPSYKSDLTACIWIEYTHIEEALVSATAWPGPVSLVVVTTDVAGSTGYNTLLSYLFTKHASTNTFVHVLYLPSVAGGSSNAYLNMARFFAPTSRVILFPDGIPKSIISTGDLRWLDELPANTRHPVFLTNMTYNGFSPYPFAPVVLPRDHPVWCTERLYMFGSRMLDWQDCLWNLWLESAGEASSIAIPRVLDESKNATSISVPPLAMKIRLRWSARYRSETCAFAIKRLHGLESLSRTEKRHMQWTKRFCRETAGLKAAEIL